MIRPVLILPPHPLFRPLMYPNINIDRHIPLQYIIVHHELAIHSEILPTIMEVLITTPTANELFLI